MVAERFALDEKSRWKFPGGLVKAGESLSDAVAREVCQVGFAFSDVGVMASSIH